MTSDEFINRCKDIVINYYIDYEQIELDEDNDVFVVWYCKTLQNMKAILATHFNDQRIFELSLNGDKNEIYLDTYQKECNRKIEV